MVAGGESRRELLVSKGWIQAAALVFLVGFFILELLAYRTYQAKPPIPAKVLYPGEEVSEGQKVFLHNGLMEYGSARPPAGRLDPVAPIELLCLEELVDEPDRDRALADGGGDAVHRPVADISRGKDSGHAGLEGERAAPERPAPVVFEIRSGVNESAVLSRALPR